MNLTISKEEAIYIACQDSERFEHIQERTIGKNGRWSILMETIVKDAITDKYYALTWEAPATENQGGIVDQFHNANYTLREVQRTQVVTIDWVEVK